MKNDFDSLQKFVDEMKSTPSTNDKMYILGIWLHNEFIMKMLLYVNNPYWTYGVTSSACMKHGKVGMSVPDIFDLLDDLRNRKLTGHAALSAVNTMVLNNGKHSKLIYNIIDKDIETRANATLINKVIPGYIPEFKVALANKYEEKHVDFSKQEWYASRKLDGVRCICRIENGTVQFFSRTGKEFVTLGLLEATIKASGMQNLVLDGEMCIVKDGKEDFQATMKVIRKKGHTIKSLKFYIFDALTLDEFDSKISITNFDDRLKRIPVLLHCETLSQSHCKSLADLQHHNDEAKRNGWEGIMLRKNVGYKGKRSNDLLKVKTFLDAEYKVIRTIDDKMRFFENGKDVERETLAAVIIHHKGYEVKVGSGFSKSEREIYYNDPDKIIGKQITVQYFEETTNQDNDGLSLRFPTFKCLHGVERVV